MKNNFSKTVLITGSTGLIGSNLALTFLKEKTVKVICVGRNKAKMLSVFAEWVDSPNIEFIISDGFSFLEAIETEIDYIFHAAGPVAGSFIKTNPVEVIEPNIFGLIDCLRFLKKQKKGKLIVFSSATIYKNTSNCDYLFSEEESCSADYIESENSPYSETKRMCEVIARAYSSEYGIDVSIARLSYVYGPCCFKPDTAFYSFISNAINDENITLNKSVFQKRDNIFVEDAVKGLILIAEKGLKGEIYNVSSAGDKGNYASIVDLAEIICDIANLYAPENKKVSLCKPSDITMLPGTMLNNSKLKEMGWEIEHDIYSGVRKTFLSYKRHIEGD